MRKLLLSMLILSSKGPIFATRFSKSGRWLVSVSLDGTACLWNVVEKTLHKQYKYHSGHYLSSNAFELILIQISDCCLDVDWINETMFATCGADHKIYICKIDETQAVATLAYVVSNQYISRAQHSSQWSH